MGYEDDDNRADKAHGLPTFLSIDNTLQAAEGKSIFKDETGAGN
jgi:hypothetical protein